MEKQPKYQVSKDKAKNLFNPDYGNYYHLGTWVTGKPSRISSYSINAISRDKKLWVDLLHLHNPREIRRFAKWLIKCVKGKKQLNKETKDTCK